MSHLGRAFEWFRTNAPRLALGQPPLPAHDIRIDLDFDSATKKLKFKKHGHTVSADGSFTVDLASLGQTKKILFVCTASDHKLSVRGIRIPQKGCDPAVAPLIGTSNTKVPNTPFEVKDICGRYLLLEDTYSDAWSLGEWAYCVAFQDGDYSYEKDPEILNEGGS